MNIEISEKLFNYLEDVSGITSLTENQRLVSDLHLNSKEIIDLAIFFYGIASKKIAFGKDLSIKEILDMCEWAIFFKIVMVSNRHNCIGRNLFDCVNDKFRIRCVPFGDILTDDWKYIKILDCYNTDMSLI